MYLAVIIIVTLLGMLSGPAATAAPGLDASGVVPTQIQRDLTAEEARHTLQLLFASRSRSAQAYLDSLQPVCGGEPLYLLTRARIKKDLLPVDDDNKEEVKRLSQPIHEELDEVIRVCSERLDANVDDPRLPLLRGWAWMFKSYVQTFERSYWSAGRSAKKGKNDLIHYLESNPNEPIATGTLGAFLYFADQLPVAVRFISKFLLMPSGDREEGLRLMEEASRTPEGTPDTEVILCSIYILFEGRLEDGIAGFEKMLATNPAYMELARPFALIAPVVPARASAFSALVDEVRNSVDLLPESEFDRSTYELLRFLRAYSDRIYSPHGVEDVLEKIAESEVEHPDWVPGYAAFELGRLLATRGEFARAREVFSWVNAGNERNAYIEEDVREMLEALDRRKPEAPLLHPATVGRMYRGDQEARRLAIKTVEDLDNATVHDRFYAAEALLLNEDNERARRMYVKLASEDAAPWDHTYLMLAASRAAELYGVDGRYDKAAFMLDRAMKFYHKEFLYDWVLEGRQRYYKRLDEGSESIAPRLYSSSN